jgi:hypothetical protein
MHVLRVGILWQSNRTNFFTNMDIFEVAEFDRRCFTHEVVVQELQLNLSYNARDLEFELHACALRWSGGSSGVCTPLPLNILMW